MLRLLLFALLALPASAQVPPGGWPAPGDGFDWQPLGDQPVKSRDFAFDAQGRLWVIGSRTARLDAPETPGAPWTFMDPLRGGGGRILPIGAADTVYAGDNSVRFTFDGGETWDFLEPPSQTAVDGNESLQELATDAPLGPGGLGPGDLLAADDNGLWRSTDRGLTWTNAPFLGPEPYPFYTVLDVLQMPAGTPRAGHLVAAMIGGGYVSDTTASGALALRRGTGHETQTALEHLAIFPSGRLLATGYRFGGGVRLAFTSDDGGESWTERAPLPEPADGIPGDAWLAVIGPASAFAIGGRGIVYRTDDAGVTWFVAGRVPITDDALTSQKLLVDGQGRLIVGLMRAGANDTDAWVYRTATPVLVADEAPPTRETLGLSVFPNPSAGGTVTIEFRQASPQAVRAEVYDAVGRRMAVLHEGAVVGVLSLDVDTSGWAPGVYTVRVTGGGAVAAETFIVVR